MFEDDTTFIFFLADFTIFFGLFGLAWCLEYNFDS
jgi:hypothetical protein